jgi:hypothetical protein
MLDNAIVWNSPEVRGWIRGTNRDIKTFSAKVEFSSGADRR